MLKQLSVILLALVGTSHGSRYGLLRVQHDAEDGALINLSSVSSNGENSRQLREEDFYFSERNGRHLSFAFDEASLPMTLVPSESPTASATPPPTAVAGAVDSSSSPTIEVSGLGDDEGAVTSGMEGVSSVEAGVDADEPGASTPSRSRISGAPTAMIAVAGTLAFAVVLVIAVKKIVPRGSASGSSASESGREDNDV